MYITSMFLFSVRTPHCLVLHVQQCLFSKLMVFHACSFAMLHCQCEFFFYYSSKLIPCGARLKYITALTCTSLYSNVILLLGGFIFISKIILFGPLLQCIVNCIDTTSLFIFAMLYCYNLK